LDVSHVLRLRRIRIGLIVWLCLIHALVSAQGRFEGRVKVAVTPEPIADQVLSLVTRELRRLQGVTVVREDPDWTLELIAVETRTADGLHLGYAISTVVYKNNSAESRRKFVAGIKSDASKLMMDNVLAMSRGAHDHTLHIGPDLRELCEAVVAKFDGAFLEPNRLVATGPSGANQP
jgi:hypothetical protein